MNGSSAPSDRDKRLAASDRLVGYARRGSVLGDVRIIDSRHVAGTTMRGRPFSWKRGPDVELIEFGSFNPANDNYGEGGRVIGH